MTQPQLRLRLVCAAFLALFVELALIRFVPAYVRVVAYYTNLILIASFFGLGLGFLAARYRKSLEPLFLPFVLLTVALTRLGHRLPISGQGNPDEPLWGVDPGVTSGVPMALVVLVLYAVIALTFIPIGQVMGRMFGRLPRLEAYSLDLGGSLLGVLMFGLCSHLGTPPLLWFGVAGVVVVVALLRSARARLLGVAVSIGVLVLVGTFGNPGELWSPYYKVEIVPRQGRQVILTNGNLHQIMLDVESTQDRYSIETVRRFQTPYRLAHSLEQVLIVGAGSGNDVAIALRMGAKHIDAVEIDAMFPRLGERLHPQHPYGDRRVTLHIADARTYFKRCTKRYDMIVFGTLDSQALVGGLSTVRLDNYVYTRESFEEAHRLLRPGGLVAVFHLSMTQFIADRIYGMLELAGHGAPHVVHFQPATLFNMLFIQSQRLPAPASDPAFRARVSGQILPTDDWPFLYLRTPGVPQHYGQVLLGMLLLGLLGAGIGLRGRARSFDPALFLLGAGFLLLETGAVTRLSLLFGSTWKVHLLVFSAILGVLLLANLYVVRRERTSNPLDIRLLTGALLVLLFLLGRVEVGQLASQPLALQWLLGGLLVAAPIGLAGLIFPTLFARAADPQSAFASNLLGAIVGGLAEYASLAYGVRALSFIAIACYAVAMLCASRSRTAP